MVCKTFVLYIALFSLQFKETVSQEFEEHFYTGEALKNGHNHITTLREIKETFIISFKATLTNKYFEMLEGQFFKSFNKSEFFSFGLENFVHHEFGLYTVYDYILNDEVYSTSRQNEVNAFNKWSDITISQLKINSKYFLQFKVNDKIVLNNEALEPPICTNTTVYFSLNYNGTNTSNYIKDIYIATGRMNPCKSEEWKYYEGFCYWSSLYQTIHHQSNWFNAAKECLKKKSDLVSIQSAHENEMVFTLNKCVNTWTGLVLTKSNEKSLNEGWEWFDNSQKTYTNWNTDITYIDQSGCSYLFNNNGTWKNNLHCANNQIYYVCKKKAYGSKYLSYSLKLIDQKGSCDDGWFGLGKKCYFVSLNKTDYFEALIQCQTMKSQIVSVKSSKEGADLTQIYNSCDIPWIGLENTNPNKVSDKSSWKWSDGTDINYQNWIDEGIYDDKQKQCGVLQKGAKWENVYCWEEHRFICQKEKQ